MDLDQMAYRCPKAEVEIVRLEVSADLCSRRKLDLATIFPEEEAMWTASSGH